MKSLPLQANESQVLPILQWFIEYLPPKPYCTDKLGVLFIYPKATAIKNAYIQYNPITRAYWFVFDIDNPQSRYWSEEWHIPTPNIEVRNPANNHQHLFYLIDPAVYTLRQARRKPLELAADIDRGLTELLGADPKYGKLIAKNPLHEHWIVYVWHEHKWSLNELVEYIPRRKAKWKPKEEVGLGRNCTVFEETRLYAYSEWRRLKFDNYDRLFEAVYAYAMELNEDFIPPMLKAEVKCIVRSVSKWTAKHITKAGFQKWGDIRREKSIKVRQTKTEERANEVKAFKAANPDITREDLALLFGVSERTIHNTSGISQSRQTKSHNQAAEVKALYAGGKTQKQIAAILGISERHIRRLLLS